MGVQKLDLNQTKTNLSNTASKLDATGTDLTGLTNAHGNTVDDVGALTDKVNGVFIQMAGLRKAFTAIVPLRSPMQDPESEMKDNSKPVKLPNLSAAPRKL